ncbi:family 16 glycosylhydrolase [bacterium]|nr:family 16 glycosylhydrolase [bacterium]
MLPTAKLSFKYFTALILLSLLCDSGIAKAYRGGELRTFLTYRYGRFEVHMQSAPHSGVVSSLFTYHELGGGGLEVWNEIDIEFLGRYPNRVQFNTITDWSVSHEQLVNIPFNPAQSFHTYAFEWTPDYVAWFIDGAQFYSQTGDHISELDRFQKIMMNIWQPDYIDWVGPFDPADLPVYAFYDWITYYEYVPGTGNAGTNNDFQELWHDDFDSWNTTRWQKATHTWDGNNVDFTYANVVFQDGYMILCMTTPTEQGYHGPSLPVDHVKISQPNELRLSEAWPNPFNSSTNLSLEVPPGEDLVFQIFDTSGKILLSTTLVQTNSISQVLSWDGRNQNNELLSSGVYFISVTSTLGRASQKVLMLK